MNPVAWKTCPDFNEWECCFNGHVRRKDGNPTEIYILVCDNPGKRKYRSLTDHWTGRIYSQVFKCFGPKNPDPERYNMVDHKDNNPLNDHINNMWWSNRNLNNLNTTQFKGWTVDKSCNRKNKYKANVKWMRKAYTLGRFKTAEEAHERYEDCKAWIQTTFRENIYEDEVLVRVYKAHQVMESFKRGARYPISNVAWSRINSVWDRLMEKNETDNGLS